LDGGCRLPNVVVKVGVERLAAAVWPNRLIPSHQISAPKRQRIDSRPPSHLIYLQFTDPLQLRGAKPTV
jgi:hypothetical protein